MARELCFCEACVTDRQSQYNAERTPVSLEEYRRLVIVQIQDMRNIARTEGRPLSLAQAAEDARQIVNDFYEIEEGA